MPKRIINAHVASLPYYRGRAPINWAIINGEEKVGVTVHYIEEGIDTGPIIVQEEVEVNPKDRAIDLLLKTLPLFPKLVVEAVTLIEEGRVHPIPQEEFSGSYFPRRVPEDGLIDWYHENSLEIYNKVRALADPYPGAFIVYNDQKIVVERAALPEVSAQRKVSPLPGLVFGKSSSGGVKVTTIDGCVMLEELSIEGQCYKAGEYFRMGSRLAVNPLQEVLALKAQLAAMKGEKGDTSLIS